MGKLIINGGGAGTGSDDVTALRNHVLTGKTAVTNDSDDEPVMGTMPEYADKQIFTDNTTSLTKYEIGSSNVNGYFGYLTHNFKSVNGDKEGHFNKNSSIRHVVYGLHPDIVKYGELLGKNPDGASASTFSTGKYTGDGTIVASDVLNGKKAYSKGASIIGTMANKGGTTTAATSTLDNTNKRLLLAIPANGFYNTAAKLYDTFANIASRIGLTAAKLATGNTILGIAGTYKGLGNATASQVLSGSKFSTASLSNATGTMPNRGTVSSALNCSGSYTIPAGYHNGSGRVTANSLSGQTAATATAGQIWTGKTAWVNGSKITGTLATQGGSTTTPGTSNKTIVTANKIVTGSIVVEKIPEEYIDTSEDVPAALGISRTRNGYMYVPGKPSEVSYRFDKAVKQVLLLCRSSDRTSCRLFALSLNEQAWVFTGNLRLEKDGLSFTFKSLSGPVSPSDATRGYIIVLAALYK